MKFPRFNKRPAYTLLYVTEQKTVRIDLDKAGALIGEAYQLSVNCTSPAKLADCITAFSLNHSPLGSKLWLLYTGLPVTVLSIPTVQVEGIPAPALSQALLFELEGLTGQSCQDLQVAYQLLSNQDEMSSYWVSQIVPLHFEDLSLAIKKAGSQLQGLMNPAGLPLALQNPETDAWLRIESWPQQVVALSNSAESGLRLQAFAVDNRQWPKQLEKWLTLENLAENTETLLYTAHEPLPETTLSLALNDMRVTSEWLALWATVLLKQDPPYTPVLRHQSKLNKDLVFMAAGGVLALLICLGHLGWHLYQANHYGNEVSALQKVETNLASLRKALTEDQDKRDKLNTKIAKLKTDAVILPKLMQGLQHRTVRLLAAIAQGRPEKLLVETISTEKDTLKISGISLDSTSANELGHYLETHLGQLGWELGAPTKKNMGMFSGGGPWEFEIKLLDLGMAGFNPKKPN